MKIRYPWTDLFKKKPDIKHHNNTLIESGPIFCLFLRVSSVCAQPITGQATEVTCPAIGQAQSELTPSKRQKRSWFFLSRRHDDADDVLEVQSNPVISRAVNSRKSVSRACTLDPKF